MQVENIRLKIDAPTEVTLPGRGFYQVEEDCLYVYLGHKDSSHKFFSFLESESVKMDIDRHGRLIFLEVSLPRHRWTINPNLRLQEKALSTDIRWLDFRVRIPEPLAETNDGLDVLKLTFSTESTTSIYQLSEKIFVEVDQRNQLNALWITGIIDDIAGQEIASYRKALGLLPVGD